MTDYSKMNDLEVNKRVFKELTGHKPLGYPHHADGRSVGNPSNGEYLWYDYCNDPAGAWPIIVKNEICIEFENDEVGGVRQVWAEASNGHFTQDDFQSYPDANPLRAAMIVFLMMKETEQCSS